MTARYTAEHCTGTVLWVVLNTETGDYVTTEHGTVIYMMAEGAFRLADRLNDAEDGER